MTNRIRLPTKKILHLLLPTNRSKLPTAKRNSRVLKRLLTCILVFLLRPSPVRSIWRQDDVRTAVNVLQVLLVGLSIPLWYGPHDGRVRSAELNRRASESNLNYYHQSLQNQLQQASQMLQAHKNNLDYYLSSSLPNADLILKQAQIAFQQGEIGYPEYLLGIRNAIAIKENYLKTLNDYNQSVIYIQYLTGKK